MSWFSRTFSNSDSARIERARRFLERNRCNDARMELEGIDTPEARALLSEALRVLAALNIEEAKARYTAGDLVGAQEHMELAQQFGATTDDLQGARRLAREIRQEQRQRAEAEAAAQETPMGDDPIWRLPPDHPRLRYAVLVESYPEALQERLVALGEDFASAVMLLEDGQAEAAFTQLGEFRADPVARYERARAALAAGKLPAAASDLMVFGDHVGHLRIGTTHTAAMLAGVLARLGRAEEALGIIDAELSRAEDLELAATRASLLEVSGKLEEAEAAAEVVLRKAPRQMGLYRQLARIRERQGKRVAAAQTLEWGLDTCCGSPGRCGNQPLDVQAVRSLARIYLEDRVQPDRTASLLEKLARSVEQPGWEDRYLAALIARNTNAPDADEQAAQLVEGLPPSDPRRRVVSQAFAQRLDVSSQ